MSGTWYTVRQGDCLSSIAHAHGLHSWRLIYDHAENEQFRNDRPDPHIIHPGDRVFVPEPEDREESGDTEQKHRFRKHTEPVHLNIFLENDAGEPLEGTYRLNVGSLRVEGELQDGKLSHPIPPDARSGTLLHIPPDGQGPESTWTVNLGALDPIEGVDGVQNRLINLGFDPGPVDDDHGDRTAAAIIEFQKAAFPDDESKWTGELDHDTRAQLEEHHKI